MADGVRIHGLTCLEGKMTLLVPRSWQGTYCFLGGFFPFFSYWGRVVLQCCVSFYCTAKWSSLCCTAGYQLPILYIVVPSKYCDSGKELAISRKQSSRGPSASITWRHWCSSTLRLTITSLFPADVKAVWEGKVPLSHELGEHDFPRNSLGLRHHPLTHWCAWGGLPRGRPVKGRAAKRC